MLAADAHFEAHFDCDAALARRRRDLGEGACWSAFVPAAGRSPSAGGGAAPCGRALWALARAVRDRGFGRLECLRLRGADLGAAVTGGSGADGGTGSGAAGALATALGGSRGLRGLEIRRCEVCLCLWLFLLCVCVCAERAGDALACPALDAI